MKVVGVVELPSFGRGIWGAMTFGVDGSHFNRFERGEGIFEDNLYLCHGANDRRANSAV